MKNYVKKNKERGVYSNESTQGMLASEKVLKKDWSNSTDEEWDKV